MSLTKATYSMIQGAPFNVLDYGADLTGVADSTTAIQAALDAAEPSGATVYFPAGLYKVTATLNASRGVTLLGEGNPFPVAAFDPTQQFAGAVISKNHNGDCISVVGTGAYSEAGGIYNLSVISNNNTYTTGDAFVIDKVGSYTIEQCSVWSCGGNGFSLGDTLVTDVTGQIFVRNLYVNNCGGYAYYFRCKWLRAYNIVSDGCSWGAWFQDASEGLVNGFHFEGFTTGGIKLAGASGWNTFEKGFIGMTDPASTLAVDFADVAGNRSSTFEAIKIVGAAGATGFTLPSAAADVRISDCYISGLDVGINNDSARGTTIYANVFDECVLPISEGGTNTSITNNTFVSTSGSYCIDHVAGSFGVWTGNVFDEPLLSTASGAGTGAFLANLVKDNQGFITHKRDAASVASGVAFAHGLGAIPATVFVNPISPFTLPADLTVAWNSTNITLTWTGAPTTRQFSWDASCICANVA